MLRQRSNRRTTSHNRKPRQQRYRRSFLELLEDRRLFDCNSLLSTVLLETTSTNGAATTSVVNVGKTFELRASVSKNVFAAYMDITYAADLASIDGPVHREKYYQGTNLNQLSPGLLNDIGGFLGPADLLPPKGGGLLFSLPMKALQPGTIKFTGRAPGRPPFTDMGVFGCDNSVPPKNVNWGEVTLVVNRPPLFTNPGNRAVDEENLLSFALSATDTDIVNGVADSITYSIASGSLPGMTLLGSTGTFTWTPTEAQDGEFIVVFRATDNHGGSEDQTITITVHEINGAPTLVHPEHKTLDEKTALSFTLSGADDDVVHGVHDKFTFTIASGSVSGMSLESSTGEFGWTPTELQDGQHTVVFRAIDNHGNAGEDQTVTIAVREVNEPPTLIGPANSTVNELQTLTFSLSAADNDVVAGIPVGTTVVIAAGQNPGMSVDGSTGFFSWTPTEAEDGQYVVVFRATDDFAASGIELTSTITVNDVNEPPIVNNPGDLSVNENATVSFTLTGLDGDLVAGVADTFSYSILSGGQPGMTLDSNSGALHWTPTEAQDGAFTVVFRAKDNHDLAGADQTVAIAVNEVNDPPVFPSPGDKILHEFESLAFTLSASDSDVVGGVLDTVSYTVAAGAQVGMTLNARTGEFAWTPNAGQVGEHTITLRATDDHAVFHEQTISITVYDLNEAPTDIAVSNLTVDENVPGAVLGDVTISDFDSGQTHALLLSNDALEIVSGKLKLKPTVSVDFETSASQELEITATDSGSPPMSITKSFTLTVRDVNEPPTAVLLSSTTIQENISGGMVGTLSVTDPDAGQTHTFITADPRFEILGGTLKFKDDQYADLDNGATINVEVTATDSESPSQATTQTLLIDVTPNAYPWHNEIQPYDTNGDGSIVPQDVLRLINQLNASTFGSGGRLPDVRASNSAFYDTNEDGFCTPLDALRIINYLGNTSEAESADNRHHLLVDELVIAPTPNPVLPVSPTKRAAFASSRGSKPPPDVVHHVKNAARPVFERYWSRVSPTDDIAREVEANLDEFAEDITKLRQSLDPHS